MHLLDYDEFNIYTTIEDVKEYIKNLPSNKKRVATLSLIGEDNLLWTKINEIIKEEKFSIDRSLNSDRFWKVMDSQPFDWPKLVESMHSDSYK